MSGGRQPIVVFADGSTFRGYLPEPRLRAVVELVWMTAGVPRIAVSRVLPNGVLELIINLSQPQRVVRAGDYTRYRQAWVAGLQRGPLDIASEVDSYLVGIRFRPGGGAAFLGLPAHQLTDAVVEWEGRLASWVAELRTRLLEATSDEARLEVVEAALCAVQRRVGPPDARIGRALAAMALAPAGLGVARLADSLGVSHKHLIALFQREVGVTPKALQRILRFQAVLRAVERADPPSWTELAHLSGYADQAHMNHDFRVLAGVAPGAYLRTRTVDPNHVEVPAR